MKVSLATGRTATRTLAVVSCRQSTLRLVPSDTVMSYTHFTVNKVFFPCPGLSYDSFETGRSQPLVPNFRDDGGKATNPRFGRFKVTECGGSEVVLAEYALSLPFLRL